MLNSRLRFLNTPALQFLLTRKFSNENQIFKKPMAQLLDGATLVLSDGSKVKGSDHLKDKVVALYFSAMWCPPCRAFTPVLKQYYEVLKNAGKDFEIVFVSRDRDPESLAEYFKDHHGSWSHLEFNDPLIMEYLQKYEIKTIPALKVIRSDGSVVVNDARTEVQVKGVKNPLGLFEEWLAFY